MRKASNISMFNKIVLLVVSFFFLVAVAPGSVIAQEDDWEFGLEVYLWGSSIGGKTGSGSDLEVDFGDLLDDLNMAFMGAFGARKGKWSLLADVLYLDVEGDTTVGPGIGPGVKLDLELTGWVVTPAVGYNLIETDRGRLDILGGARYLYLGTDLRLGSLPPVEDSGSFWDGIVGIRGDVKLTEKWYLPYYLDVGTGDSDLTWQALGGVGYKFNKFDIVVAYRYLYWDFADGEAIDDLDFSGPFVGFKFVF
jgi:hypothetical protein